LLSVPSPVTAILTVSPGLRNRGGLNRVIADIKKTLNDGVCAGSSMVQFDYADAALRFRGIASS
jgi:hypothetical protein